MYRLWVGRNFLESFWVKKVHSIQFKTKMKTYIFFLIITALAFVQGANSLEYFLALERCPSSPEGDFTIHGLWPQYNSTSWPQYCNTTEKFNYTALTPLLPQIQKYWGTCTSFNHTEEWFLSHEWEKHGTCTPFTEAQYFGTGLALYQILPWRLQCPPSITQCLIQVMGI
jgi:ribonuclease T2 family protein